jgi:hypothetical protein
LVRRQIQTADANDGGPGARPV